MWRGRGRRRYTEGGNSLLVQMCQVHTCGTLENCSVLILGTSSLLGSGFKKDEVREQLQKKPSKYYILGRSGRLPSPDLWGLQGSNLNPELL